MVCSTDMQKERNMLSSQTVPKVFPQNQLGSSSSSSCCWGRVAGGVNPCKEENQARLGEQRAGQVLKYAPWKEESPKRPKSYRLRFNVSQETSTILLLRAHLRNINTYIHTKTCTQGLGRDLSVKCVQESLSSKHQSKS